MNKNFLMNIDWLLLVERTGSIVWDRRQILCRSTENQESWLVLNKRHLDGEMNA